MRVLILLFLGFVAVLARPPPGSESSEPVTLLNYSFKKNPNGSYRFLYELSDGTERDEEGEVRNEGLKDQYIFVKGHYTYRGTDDILYRNDYESGIDGYKSETTEEDEGPGAGIPPSVAASLLGR